MWNNFLTFIDEILPKGDRLLMLTSGSIGGWATWAFGENFDVKVGYLFFIVMVDYLTGNMAAFKTGEWCSKTGFTGVTKKIFIFFMVAVAHSLDVLIGMGDIMRNAVIIAYAANEIASIIENASKLGFYIPPIISRGLKAVQQKQENLFKGDDVK